MYFHCQYLFPLNANANSINLKNAPVISDVKMSLALGGGEEKAKRKPVVICAREA